MARLTVRNLPEDLVEQLQRRARRHGRSTAEEVREILRTAVEAGAKGPKALGSSLAKRFERVGLREDIVELRRSKVRRVRFHA